MSHPPLFTFFQVISILQKNKLLGFCSILQNKYLAYTKSTENSHQKYISKKYEY